MLARGALATCTVASFAIYTGAIAIRTGAIHAPTRDSAMFTAAAWRATAPITHGMGSYDARPTEASAVAPFV